MTVKILTDCTEHCWRARKKTKPIPSSSFVHTTQVFFLIYLKQNLNTCKTFQNLEMVTVI